jgi:predicted DNA-binding transcriptional regulator AlpA
MADRRPLATAEQVSEFLGVPVATLYQWRYRGIGPRASKIGKHLRYRWTDIESYVDQQATVEAA